MLHFKHDDKAEAIELFRHCIKLHALTSDLLMKNNNISETNTRKETLIISHKSPKLDGKSKPY
jgi:hypothetical protein